MVVSVKPRLQGGVGPHGQASHPPRYNSQNLVEEWLQKMPVLPAEKLSVTDSAALNLSVKPQLPQGSNHSKSSTCSSQYSKLPNSGAFNLQNSPNMDSNKSRAIRDIQLAHTKDMHGN